WSRAGSSGRSRGRPCSAGCGSPSGRDLWRALPSIAIEGRMKVIVVGAGILGASTAYHLAREGCEVVLVDRADEGRATAAGAGIVCPWGSPGEGAASYALLAGGARYYPGLIAMLAEDGEQDLGYAPVGGLY